MRSRLVGFIPFGRKLLHQQRNADRERAQELEARGKTSPDGNARRIDFDGLGSNNAGASPAATARRDKESGLA